MQFAVLSTFVHNMFEANTRIENVKKSVVDTRIINNRAHVKISKNNTRPEGLIYSKKLEKLFLKCCGNKILIIQINFCNKHPI